jgi:hypothetical protein
MNYILIRIIRLARRISSIVTERWQSLQSLSVAGSFLLGFWGWNVQSSPEAIADYINNFFRTFQLITLNFPTDLQNDIPWQLQIARFMVPSITALATIDRIVGSITRPVRLFSITRAKDHIVICGDDQLATSALTELATGDSEKQIVIIDPSISESRKEVLESYNLTVIIEDPMELDFFKKVNICHASAIFMILKDDISNTNLAIEALKNNKNRSKIQSPLLVGVLIAEDNLAYQLDLCLDDSTRNNNAKYHRLCPDRDGIRLEMSRRAPVFGKIDKSLPSHILVVGLISNWQQCLMQLIIASQDQPYKKSVFTFLVSQEEEAEIEEFLKTIPELNLIVEFRYMRYGKYDLIDLAETNSEQKAYPKITLVVVLKEGGQAISTALALRSPKNPFSLTNEPMLVFRDVEDRLLQQLTTNEMQDRNLQNIIAFGGVIRKESIERALSYENDKIAVLLHEQYMSNSQNRLGDITAALREWAGLPENLRDANRVAANHFPLILEYMRLEIAPGDKPSAILTDEEMEKLSRIEHKRWIADRLDRGYRYGNIRDDKKRLHPSIVDYDDLTDAEKQKDRDNIKALMAAVRQSGNCILQKDGNLEH